MARKPDKKRRAPARSTNLARSNEGMRRRLGKLYETIENGFKAQDERTRAIAANWRIYNCELDEQQLYDGRNKLYYPIVFEAVEARATRFTNQLFPLSHRHVEAISDDGTIPRAALALAEHYVDDMDLAGLVPALVASGDLEGQYNVYVDWQESTRLVVSRTEEPVDTEAGVVGKALDAMEAEEGMGGPSAELLSDRDILVLPATAQSLDKAITAGGSVTIIRRWTKQQIKDKGKEGVIDQKMADRLCEEIDSYTNSNSNEDSAKQNLRGAGIQHAGRGKWAQVYEIWTNMEIDGEMRLCQAFMPRLDMILTCRRNPLWCDRIPLVSRPQNRVDGSFKGRPLVNHVKHLQYFANDVLNEAADSANYTLLPITFRDPAYITSPLILSPGAIWDVPPGQINFAEFPPVWQHAMEVLGALKSEVMQVLSVNPAMLASGGGPRKPTQAEVLQTQQVDLLSTSFATKGIAAVLSEVMNLVMDLDYQYRDKDKVVRAYGETGMQANLQMIPPLQVRTRYQFYWIGAEATRDMQMMQQKMATFNVLRTLPPEMFPRYKFNPQPIILDLVETVFGARMARLCFEDIQSQMTVPPDEENDLMQQGHFAPVHPMDNLQEHVQAHQASIQREGDPFGAKQAHIQDHQTMFMLAEKAKLMAAQPQPAGPGAGGGGRTAPRPGAAPGRPNTAQKPPGAIAPDQLLG